MNRPQVKVIFDNFKQEQAWYSSEHDSTLAEGDFGSCAGAFFKLGHDKKEYVFNAGQRN